jgi:hypothetical protein
MLNFLRRAVAGPPWIDKALFERDGFVVLRGVLAEADREKLRAIYAEFQDRTAQGRVTRTSVHTAGDHSELFEWIDDFPAVRAAARAILGDDYCRLLARFLIKDSAYSGPVPAHQDYPYFGGQPVKLNVFVPMTPCNRSNGSLIFIKGSHRYGPLERGTIDIDRFPELEREAIEIEPGDLLIADFLSWHYSEGAPDPTPRVMVQVIYQPSSDPSSKILVSGRLLNDAVCPIRAHPLLTRETEISFMNANVHFKHKDYPRAESLALDVLTGDPRNARVLFLLKKVCEAQGKAEEAERYGAQALAEARAMLDECAENEVD